MKVYFYDLVGDIETWVELLPCEKIGKEAVAEYFTNRLEIPLEDVEWECDEFENEVFVFICPYALEIDGQELAVVHSSKESAERDYEQRCNDI